MNDTSRILESLRAFPSREIYEAADRHNPRMGNGEYYITYRGGGPFSKTVVNAMVANGSLRRKYPDCECYCLP